MESNGAEHLPSIQGEDPGGTGIPTKARHGIGICDPTRSLGITTCVQETTIHHDTQYDEGGDGKSGDAHREIMATSELESGVVKPA